MSDKLKPLADGVRKNKEHWLLLAQNVQNKRNTGTNDSITLVSTSSNANNFNDNHNNLINNNNNNINNNRMIIRSRSSSQTSDEINNITNGTNNDIPKIVGRLNFQPKQNGLSGDTLASRDPPTQESMDQ